MEVRDPLAAAIDRLLSNLAKLPHLLVNPNKELELSVAAAAVKFKKFGARRDPNAEVIPLKKRLVNLPVRTMPHREWFVRTSTNPEHRRTLSILWDKGR